MHKICWKCCCNQQCYQQLVSICVTYVVNLQEVCPLSNNIIDSKYDKRKRNTHIDNHSNIYLTWMSRYANAILSGTFLFCIPFLTDVFVDSLYMKYAKNIYIIIYYMKLIYQLHYHGLHVIHIFFKSLNYSFNIIFLFTGKKSFNLITM